MKHIDAERLRAEIERLAKRADRRTDKDHASHNAEMERYGEDYWNGYGDLSYALLSFIDSLQKEQPSLPSDLDEAAEGEVCGRVYDHINVRFRDGVCKFLEPKNISHIPADVSKYKVGDKVKIIIVKNN